MGETVYRTMRNAGAWNLALGIILIVAGIAVGVLSILHGAQLLKNKSEVLF